MTSNCKDGMTGTQSTPGSSSLATQTKASKGANTGKKVMKSFEGFLSFVIGISIFGASTFTVIVSEIANPTDLSTNPRFTRETVRIFLSISWLLFILALGIEGFSMSKWEPLGLLASFTLQALIIGAFIFLSLVIVAYTEAVGWVAVGFTSAAAILALVLLVIQWVRLFKGRS